LPPIYGPGAATHLVRHRDGTVRWLHSTTHQLTNDGTVTVLSISRDVTTAVQARRQAEASQLRFQSAFERAPIGMSLTSLDGRILMVNEAFAALLGWTSAELHGTGVDVITHPDDRAADVTNFAELLGGVTKAHQVHKRYRHRDGHAVPVVVHAEIVSEPADPGASLIVHVLPR
jgi:PAS domain S-box-containing protein